MKRGAVRVRAVSYLLGITTMLALAGCDDGSPGNGALDPSPEPTLTDTPSVDPSFSVTDLDDLAPITGSEQAPIHWDIPDGLSKRERAAVRATQIKAGYIQALFDATGQRRQRLLAYLPLVVTGKDREIIESSLSGRHDPALGPTWNLVGPIKSRGPKQITVTYCQDLGWRGTRSDPVTEPPADDREDLRSARLVKDGTPGLTWKSRLTGLIPPQEGAPGFEGTCAAWGTHQPQRP
jgi:hypothetical protein